ncbi:hypothetical protein SAMN05216197_102136 [Pseudomonas graminis]|uniref:Uncharacterized protein n=1 Tax=Pseudomonas graminis TaxID=158627 RepID=A0A1H9Z9X0_9PSED|nr:hypothetical protein SAMN05216197_102136 [Pseudomonas graminis]
MTRAGLFLGHATLNPFTATDARHLVIACPACCEPSRLKPHDVLEPRGSKRIVPGILLDDSLLPLTQHLAVCLIAY